MTIRKNILVPSVAFTASDGSSTQPSSAYMVLNYLDTSGASSTATLTLSYNSGTNTWTGTWDSSVAGPCTVSWFAYGTGSVQAATQGQFPLEANAPNLSVS